MGNCIYCGEKAGFFSRKHPECDQRYRQGRNEIISLVCEAGLGERNLQRLESSIEKVAESNYIKSSEIRGLVVSGWENSAKIAISDETITEKQESALIKLKEHFSLSEYELDENESLTKIAQIKVLRNVLDGKISEIAEHLAEAYGNFPFNLQKGEQVVWIFEDVDYYEEKTRTQYVGGSQGVSVRLAKGLYYRVGAYKGERVQTSETVHADTGLLGVTNKHLYFVGPVKGFRIKYEKIVAFEFYSDGIGVQRDAQTAKPQTFVTGDGWFTYNLIRNLSQI